VLPFSTQYRNLARPLVLLLAMSLSVNSFAQEEEDTSYYLSEIPPDTGFINEGMEILDSIVQTYNGNDDVVDEEETDYFLPKSYTLDESGPPVPHHRALGDSLVKRLRKDDAFWYVNYDFSRKKNEPNKKNSPLSGGLPKSLLWLIVVGGFLGFLVIYLSNSNVGIFRRGNRALPNDYDSDIIPENIFEINYEREIQKAIQKSDFRLAVRLMFLRSLKNLSGKGIIRHQQDRTNFDYLMQLHGGPHYDNFFRLTRNYEYTWYGQFTIEPDKFNVIQKDFESFDNKILNH